MTAQPINLAAVREYLEAIGPPDLIAYDQETDYWQVYGDNGTICTTDNGVDAALIARTLQAGTALIDAAEAARELRDDKYGIPHWPERDTTDSIADFTGRCDPRCPGCKLTDALDRFTFEQP